MVTQYCSSKDIANLRLASRAFRQIPIIQFRRFVIEEMPWLWEAVDFPIAETDWYRLYRMVKFCWVDLKGLKNRRRIWKDVEEIVRRIGNIEWEEDEEEEEEEEEEEGEHPSP